LIYHMDGHKPLLYKTFEWQVNSAAVD
jgi:hypothetical protein